jgi:hypothetical protein
VDSRDEVIVDICHVCFWQYDEVMHDKPDIGGGANPISLNEARRNFASIGVCEAKYANKVRPPLPEEVPENNRQMQKQGEAIIDFDLRLVSARPNQ